MTGDGAEGDAADEWAKAFAALRSFYERRGTTEAPRRARVLGVDLGRWVEHVRDAYWRGELPLQQQQQVQDVGDWQWGPARPGTWRHGYDTLTAYVESYATTLTVGATEDEADLQRWMATQRKAYQDLQLNEPQIDMLESLPDWTWDPDEFRWLQGVLAVRIYVQRHGSLESIDRETRLGSYPLGKWLHRCREDYRAQSLQPTRIRELESHPGWSWGRHVDNWLDGYTSLKRFVEQHGHAAPGQKIVFEDFRLGWWVTQKRRQHRQGTLPAAQAQALETLPEWQWDPQETQWRRGFNALLAYVDDHGAATPARSEKVDGYPVGDWVRAQRDAYANGRLPQARRSRLETLAGWHWK